ncbi:MAG TPA: IS630 family transposase [Bacteroidetes bacterium]|nr:IS630 family transposase [Bacteroidota bacterium]
MKNTRLLSEQERNDLIKERNRLRGLKGSLSRYKRVCVILAIDSGYTYEEIHSLFGIAPSTTTQYKDKYLKGGLELLMENNYKTYSGKLSKEELIKLDKKLDEKVYRTTQEIGSLIEKMFGKKYSNSQVCRILKKLGYVYKKVKQSPAKADPIAQEECVKEIKKQIAQSADNKTVVLFLDATHPMHNTKPYYGWIKKGKEAWIPSNGGRKRYNVIGAMNAIKPEQVTKINAKSINEDVVIELFKKALKRYGHKEKIIAWVDGASYFKSRKVKKWLKEHPKIILQVLPPYSPNLNLIERLWKFMRKKVISDTFYQNYDDFVKSLDNFFKEIKSYKNELRELITSNFQKFPDIIPV